MKTLNDIIKFIESEETLGFTTRTYAARLKWYFKTYFIDAQQFASQPPAPVGKMWEEVEVSELPDDWESKVFLYKFDRSPVDTGLFEHMDNGLVKIGGTGRLEYSEIIWLRPVIRTTGMEEALKQIAEMSDPGSPERAIVEMKRIASDALSASTPPKEGWKDRTFTQTEIEHLQSKVHSITGDGEVMMLFNELIGVNAG